MPEEFDIETVRERMADAVAGALPGEMVTRWLVVVEVLGAAGDRAVYSLSPQDMQTWDVLGLAQYALALEQAGMVVDG